MDAPRSDHMRLKERGLDIPNARSEREPDGVERPAGTEPARLPPPGPLARRRRRRASASPRRWRDSVGDRVGVLAASTRRHKRPLALGALALGGAFALLTLGIGDEPATSESDRPLGGPDLPLQAVEPEAAAPAASQDAGTESARTLEEDGGGPGAEPFTGPNGKYELTLPPGWNRERTKRGSVALGAPGGEANVLIRVSGSGKGGVGELADEAARVLARRADGARVARVPSRSEGELLAVAKVSGGGEVSTAYIADAGGVQYLVISSRSVGASALVRLQQRGVIRGFRSQPSG